MVADLQTRLADAEQERTREKEHTRDLTSQLETERGRAADFRKRLADLLAEYGS